MCTGDKDAARRSTSRHISVARSECSVGLANLVFYPAGASAKSEDVLVVKNVWSVSKKRGDSIFAQTTNEVGQLELADHVGEEGRRNIYSFHMPKHKRRVVRSSSASW